MKSIPLVIVLVWISGPFSYFGGYGYWPSSAESPNNPAMAINLSNNFDNFVRSSSDRGNRYSILCLKR